MPLYAGGSSQVRESSPWPLCPGAKFLLSDSDGEVDSYELCRMTAKDSFCLGLAVGFAVAVVAGGGDSVGGSFG